MTASLFPTIYRLNALAVMVLCWLHAAAVLARPAPETAFNPKDEHFAQRRLGRQELDAILAEHVKWVDSQGKEGKRAELVGVAVSGITLQFARFSGASLRGSEWINVTFIHASFTQADLREAKFIGCDLSNADLEGADVSNAIFSNCTLADVVYDQKLQGYPNLGVLAGNDLTRLTCNSQRGGELGLVELQNAFKANNLRAAEREVTYAIEKRRTAQLWKDGHWFEAGFRTVLFDWPVGYGLYFGRPLKLVCLFVALFTPVYFIAIVFRSRFVRGGIWAVRLEDALDKNVEACRPVRMECRGSHWWHWLSAITRSFGVAFFFSLLSAVRMGYRDLNVGTWLANMQPREYTLRGTGWVRAVSGFQSLLSVYLIALWLLCYFGRPFE